MGGPTLAGGRGPLLQSTINSLGSLLLTGASRHGYASIRVANLVTEPVTQNAPNVEVESSL